MRHLKALQTDTQANQLNSSFSIPNDDDTHYCCPQHPSRPRTRFKSNENLNIVVA
jgi:hypothetical protein